jgi:Uma2 family endonuclease
MATETKAAELVAAPSRIDGKAEIVGGEIVVMSPTGDLPSRAAAAVYRRLWEYERRARSGRAYTDNVGPAAEQAMAAKRADYFAAGAQLVWDVDVLREGLIRVYRSTMPDAPSVYGRGDQAEAEPALPGWTFQVDEIFD